MVAISKASLRQSTAAQRTLDSSPKSSRSSQCFISNRELELNRALSFIRYAMTTAFPSSGNCVTSIGAFVTLSTPYIASAPYTLNTQVFQSAAQSQFANYLGFSTCNNQDVSVAASVPSGSSLTSSVLPTLSSSPIVSIAGHRHSALDTEYHHYWSRRPCLCYRLCYIGLPWRSE